MLLSLLLSCAPATTTGMDGEGTSTGTTADPGETTGSTACEAITDLPEGAFVDRGAVAEGALPDCSRAWHAAAGSADSTLELSLAAWDGAGTATVTITDLLGDALAVGTGLEPGQALSVTLDRSGEVMISVQPDDPLQAGSYGLSLTCTAGCDLAYTRHPLVFMHGMAGTDSFLDLVDYWYGIEDPLIDAGYAVVVGAVDPFQTSELRAEQWRAIIDEQIALGNGRRFNLIAHSQGGIDARYLASVLDPEQTVASVLTIATPHQGSALGSLVDGDLIEDSLTGAALDALVDALAGLYGLDSDQDIIAQTLGLSADAMADFNETVLDRDDVLYASWGGRTCQLLDVVCQIDTDGEIVDALLALPHAANLLFEGDNDGLVGVESSEWGNVRGVIGADHLDQIGLGITAPGFDPPTFYLGEAAWLAEQGL